MGNFLNKGNFLSQKQRKELLKELKSERLRRYADRIRVILLLDEGETYKNISNFLFLDEGSIANYKKYYNEDGLEGLISDNYPGRQFMLTDEQLTVLDGDLQEKLFLNTDAIIDHVKKKFSVKYSRGGMTKLLHRMGFSFKRPKGVPGKANKIKQENFIKEYVVHSTHNTKLNYGWIKRGTNFEAKKNSERNYQ